MIRALPAYYAGHTFRSRLEARWAVEFDRRGWDWQYEPQGYALTTSFFCPNAEDADTHGWNEASSRCGTVGNVDDLDTPDVACWHANYLPDFYVDNVGWVEVKGRLSIRDVQMAAMAGLASRGGLPVAPDGEYLDGYTRAPALHIVGTGGWDAKVTVHSLYKGDVSATHQKWRDPITLFYDAPEWGPYRPSGSSDLLSLEETASDLTSYINDGRMPPVKFNRSGQVVT